MQTRRGKISRRKNPSFENFLFIRRPRGIAAQFRPIVFNQWSAPPLHVAASHVFRVEFSGQQQAMSLQMPTPGELLRACQRYQLVLLHAAQAQQPTAVRARVVFPAPSTRAGVPIAFYIICVE